MRISEGFIWEMAWERALKLAFAEFALLSILCYIAMIVLFFRKGETAVGILCSVCLVVPGLQPVGIVIAVIFGWMRARKWELRAFMTLWTGVVVLAILNIIATEVLGKLDQSTLETLFGPYS